jgi:hypothetical protein
MIVNTTNTNAPALIATDHHVITPTPRRASLAITTEMEHHYMMTRRDTKNKQAEPKDKKTHQPHAPQKKANK